MAFAHLKQYSQAVQAYREAIRNRAEYDEAWHKLDVAYANLKESARGSVAFRYAIHWAEMKIARTRIHRAHVSSSLRLPAPGLHMR